MAETADALLDEKGYVAFVDVLMRMGKLTREGHEAWRFGRARCLEEVIQMNLPRISRLLRAFQHKARDDGLRASKTAYVSWGKGAKRPLQFSKTGDPNIEAAYATHFLRARG